MDIIPTRQEILAELEQFDNDYSDREELFSVISEYIEQVAEEAAGLPRKREEVILKSAEPPAAVAIEIYDLFIDAQSNIVGGAPKQIAYAIASGLLRNYDFYLKDRR